MDNARKIELLEHLIAEAAEPGVSEFYVWREKCQQVLEALLPTTDVGKRFNMASHPSLPSKVPGRTTVGRPDPNAATARAVTRGVGVLRATIARLQVDDERAQPSRPDERWRFHPWIEDAMAQLDGATPLRVALDLAAGRIEKELKDRLNVTTTGKTLAADAFKKDNPRTGERRLRFTEFTPESRAWTNAHEGTQHFVWGCMMRLRNMTEHHEVDYTDEEALEGLAAFSLLARWIESAEIKEG